ncbi:MAG TPA: hypothetical protein VIG69_05310 [Candidatus Methylomirabilis sp.]
MFNYTATQRRGDHMKVSKLTAFVGIAAIVLASAAPGFAQQGASCSVEIAQVRAQIWRAQAAIDVTQETAATPQRGKALASAPTGQQQGEISGAGRSMPGQGEVSGAGRALPQGEASGAGRSKSLASSPAIPQGQASGAGRALPQGEASGAGRSMPGQGEVSGAGRALPQGEASGAGRSKSLASAPTSQQQGEVSGAGRALPQGEASGAGRALPQGEASGAGRALAAAPGFTPAAGPASGAARVSSVTNAQFRVLSSDQDRKAFVGTLNEQERTLLYQTLSAPYKKRVASVMSAQDQKSLGQKLSDQDVKAWAEKIATDRTALSQKITKARALARTASDLCKKGDSDGAAAKAKEAMEALK